MVILVLGVLWGLKLISDYGYLSDSVKILLAYALSIGLIVLPYILEKKQKSSQAIIISLYGGAFIIGILTTAAEGQFGQTMNSACRNRSHSCARSSFPARSLRRPSVRPPAPGAPRRGPCSRSQQDRARSAKSSSAASVRRTTTRAGARAQMQHAVGPLGPCVGSAGRRRPVRGLVAGGFIARQKPRRDVAPGERLLRHGHRTRRPASPCSCGARGRTQQPNAH